MAARTLCERRSELEQSKAVGKFHGWNNINALTQLSRVESPVSATLNQPTLCCFLDTSQRSLRQYPSHAVFTADSTFKQYADTTLTCHPDVGLLLSLVRIVVCWDCHVTSSARSA